MGIATAKLTRRVLFSWLLLIPVIGNAATASVAAGGFHSVALKNNGTLVAVGDDRYGQLGLGRVVQSTTPLHVLGLGQVRAIAAGNDYTVALKQDGTVWAWGDNEFGQLGDSTTTNRSTPAPRKNYTICLFRRRAHWFSYFLE